VLLNALLHVGQLSRSLTLVLLGVALWATPLAAQRASSFVWDPDRDWQSVNARQHFLAGAGIDAIEQGIGWPRRWWQRVTIVAVVGAAYEAGQESSVHDDPAKRGPGYGFGVMDLGLDIAGALISEGLGSLLRKIF